MENLVLFSLVILMTKQDITWKQFAYHMTVAILNATRVLESESLLSWHDSVWWATPGAVFVCVSIYFNVSQYL